MTNAFFLIHKLFDCSRKIGGRGKGFRKVDTPQDADKKSKAEDYIPYGEQVESALEMIEEYGDQESALFSSSVGSALNLIKGVQKHYDDELLDIEKEAGKNIFVIMVTSKYPWGLRGGDEELPAYRKDFVELLNEFEDLPVTFVFLVESQEHDIIHFYDQLVSSESEVKADVRVSKGLGLMIEGVSKHNPWLNYCLPMHLCQVLGVCGDVLSQAAATRPLCAAEARELCSMLIGDVPDSVDVEKFYDAVKVLMSDSDQNKWNPATGKEGPICDAVKLKKHFSKVSGLVGLLTAMFVCIVAIIVGHLSGHISFN